MSPFSTPSSRWAAVQTRNPLASSAFIYSVTTTKIYCRPTCPSRLARRANIKFHDSAAEAEADGFRACKRCRPESGTGDQDPQVAFVNKACGLIEKELEGEQKWSVKALAKEVGLTESHFCRVFKKVLGVTIGEYRNQIKPRSLDLFSKESPIIPDTTQGTASGAPQFDPLSETNAGNWNWSMDQQPPCPKEARYPSKDFFSIADHLPNDPLLGLEYMDFESAELPCAFDFSDQQHFDSWDNGDQYINYNI